MFSVLAPMVVARKGYYTDLAQWASKKGFETLRVDGAYLPTADWPRLARGALLQHPTSSPGSGLKAPFIPAGMWSILPIHNRVLGD